LAEKNSNWSSTKKKKKHHLRMRKYKRGEDVLCDSPKTALERGMGTSTDGIALSPGRNEITIQTPRGKNPEKGLGKEVNGYEEVQAG